MRNRGQRGLMGRAVMLALITVSAGGLLGTSSAGAGTTERVSGGSPWSRHSSHPSISADGRYVAFVSSVSILVPGDTNSADDVFVRDRLTGTIERVSVDSAGGQGNGPSSHPSLSADGRYVAFVSAASNLVPNDTNDDADIFVRDRLTGTTERVSVDSRGVQANRDSFQPSISADGRYVAFGSGANLVLDDTNGKSDVFVRDRLAGVTERVSVDSTGAQGLVGSAEPSISADGRYVAFRSSALVPDDTNGAHDIFVHDRVTRTTERVSVDSAGRENNRTSQEPSISADGRYVAFATWSTNLVPGDTNLRPDVFVRDRLTGTTERVSVDSAGDQGNDSSVRPSLSADGRYVAFTSSASNLVPDDTNGAGDVFVRDRLTGTTERVSVDSAGGQGNGSHPSLSADGRHVAFVSAASNLVPEDSAGTVDIFVHDRLNRTTERVSVDSPGDEANNWSTTPSISADARYVASASAASNLVPGDTNGVTDVFVYDRQTGVTERVSVMRGLQVNSNSGEPSLSADGRYVAFTWADPEVTPGGLPGVFVHDRSTRATERVSVDNRGAMGGWSVARPSSQPNISADGRYVAFVSRGAYVPDDTNGVADVFVRDRLTGTTERVSVDSAGGQADLGSLQPRLSADGRYVAFVSNATNLVPGDTNGKRDIFVRDRATGITERVSVDSAGDQGAAGSGEPSISADGRYVAFRSWAALVPDDTNSALDVYVRDRLTGTTERVSMFSHQPSISADGRYVAFVSWGVSQVFIRDRVAGITEQVSVNSAGVAAQPGSFAPSISADGRHVAFVSSATDLVRDDTNGVDDVFVRSLDE